LVFAEIILIVFLNVSTAFWKKWKNKEKKIPSHVKTRHWTISIISDLVRLFCGVKFLIKSLQHNVVLKVMLKIKFLPTRFRRNETNHYLGSVWTLEKCSGTTWPPTSKTNSSYMQKLVTNLALKIYVSLHVLSSHFMQIKTYYFYFSTQMCNLKEQCWCWNEHQFSILKLS
jgi:hypothetical protein